MTTDWGGPDDIDVGLSPEIRELLQAEKSVPPAPAGAKAEVFARLQASIAAAPVELAPESEAPIPGSELGMARPLSKPIMYSALGVAAAAAVFVWMQPRAEAPVAESEAVIGASYEQTPDVVPAPFDPPSVPTPEAVRPAPIQVVARTPADPVDRLQRRPAAALDVEPPPMKVETPAPRKVESPRDVERKLLREARRSMLAGNAAVALKSLAEHKRRFPGSRLTQERQALNIQALARSGRLGDARRAARAFEARYPESIHLRAVREAAGL